MGDVILQEDSKEVGGICGNNTRATVSCCYSVGDIEAADIETAESFGSVIGSAVDGTMENLYYIDTCGLNAGVGTALTDEQLRNAESYAGFDFEAVWVMGGSADYPYAELVENPLPDDAPIELPKGDMNGDGIVDIQDALLVLRYALGLISEL